MVAGEAACWHSPKIVAFFEKDTRLIIDFLMIRMDPELLSTILIAIFIIVAFGMVVDIFEDRRKR